MADKFPFFASYYEALKELPPEEFKAVMVAMCERAFNETEVELDGTAKGFYTLIKPIIEKSLALSEIRSEQGKKGGRPAGEKASQKQTESKPKANRKQMESKPKADKDKDKDKDIKEKQEKEKVASAPRFVKPTVAEVSAYCRERANGINPESFVDFYEAKGWKVGSQPMKDWKACVRTWEQRRKTDRASPKVNSFANFQQNHYTSAEMSELERKLLEN
jgi:hypothetical protein